MNSSNRQRYLEAMGIRSWRLRNPSEAPTAEEAATVAAVAAYGEAAELEVALDKAIAEPAPAIFSEVDSAKSDGQSISMDWPNLEATVKTCTACGLCEGRSQAVFGVGDLNADLLVVGEGPGAEEDKQGLPFVGPAGQLLDAMLKAINYARYPEAGQQGAYIANIVKCRPPNNRDPEADEAAACRPYLERQIALLQPKLILAVGRVAAQNLLQTDAALGSMRGSMHRHEASSTPVFVTYHPAYLLRSPGEKRKAWEDLKQVRQFLAGS